MNMTDTMGMTGGMEEEAAHTIQPKPTLTSQPEVVRVPSDGSTPFNPPMSEMNQMEVQFNNPTQQAEIIAEQQRATAIQNELERQK